MGINMFLPNLIKYLKHLCRFPIPQASAKTDNNVLIVHVFFIRK